VSAINTSTYIALLTHQPYGLFDYGLFLPTSSVSIFLPIVIINQCILYWFNFLCVNTLEITKKEAINQSEFAVRVPSFTKDELPAKKQKKQ
jgi:hypothetical protein